jgi:hypothetical protein
VLFYELSLTGLDEAIFFRDTDSFGGSALQGIYARERVGRKRKGARALIPLFDTAEFIAYLGGATDAAFERGNHAPQQGS